MVMLDSVRKTSHTMLVSFIWNLYDHRGELWHQPGFIYETAESSTGFLAQLEGKTHWLPLICDHNAQDG